MFTNSLKQSLDGFLNGDYEGNRARVVLALQDISLDEHSEAKSYVEGLPASVRQRELVDMLTAAMTYEGIEVLTGSKGEKKIGFSEADIKRMAAAKRDELETEEYIN